MSAGYITFLGLIASDVISRIPTLDEVKPFNGACRRKFSGKHRVPSTAGHGGFKEVLDLVNHGTEAAKVTATTPFHDSWDERLGQEEVVVLAAGESVWVPVTADGKRFIRRLDLSCDAPGSVKLEQFAFVMSPRSKLNLLSANPAIR